MNLEWLRTRTSAIDDIGDELQLCMKLVVTWSSALATDYDLARSWCFGPIVLSKAWFDGAGRCDLNWHRDVGWSSKSNHDPSRVFRQQCQNDAAYAGGFDEPATRPVA